MAALCEQVAISWPTSSLKLIHQFQLALCKPSNHGAAPPTVLHSFPAIFAPGNGLPSIASATLQPLGQCSKVIDMIGVVLLFAALRSIVRRSYEDATVNSLGCSNFM